MKISVVNPDINKLGYIIAIANIRDKHDRSAPSHYHWKILKCRFVYLMNVKLFICCNYLVK